MRLIPSARLWVGVGALTASAMLVALAPPAVVVAHPLGNFTVNHYSRIEPDGDGVRLLYVVDIAEIPTLQERPRIDRDGDDQISNAERDSYAATRTRELQRYLHLTLNGADVPLRGLGQALSFPAGQGGLQTLRLEAEFVADLPAAAGNQPIQLQYRDDNNPGRIGWREIVARPAAVGTVIHSSSVTTEDRTDALRAYPDELLSSPLNVRDAQLVFVPGPRSAAPDRVARQPSGINAIEQTKSAVTSLVTPEELTPTAWLLSLLLAVVFGAQHALSPGHGKTVVAAYLVGARGTARHALFLGATVTATHTLGVYALGLATLFLTQFILPERLYPILETLSGLLVVGIGGWLFTSRLRSALAGRRSTAHEHDDAPHHTGHDHEPADGAAHEHGAALVHSHGGGPAHSHRSSGADGGPIGWRSLLALGISGGLLPCPTALVLLLGAIALHRVEFGLLLTVFFSLGLAGVLVGIGLILVYARPYVQRFTVRVRSGPLVRAIPMMSALVITLAGAAITAQALPGFGPR